MTYVLILWLAVTHKTASIVVEFSSEETCKVAESEIRKQLVADFPRSFEGAWNSIPMFYGGCFRK